jgi:cytochrome c553
MRLASKCLPLVLAGATFVLAVNAHAADPNYARSLAATCFACHGTDGRSVGNVPPSLAGQNRDYLLQQMNDFKLGKRPATIMHQHAKGYTDEQLALIAGYFASVTPAPAVAAPAARGGY